jgi:hypothetical protein
MTGFRTLSWATVEEAVAHVEIPKEKETVRSIRDAGDPKQPSTTIPNSFRLPVFLALASSAST